MSGSQDLLECLSVVQSPQRFRFLLLLTTSVWGNRRAAQESHHQQQRSVMTTTHCGHDAACSGTVQSVSKGYVRMEAWEVKGCPVLMCAGHGSLNFRRQRSKVHMKKCCWCKAEKRPVENPVLVVLRWLIQAEFPAWINSNSALKFFAFIPLPLYSVATFFLSFVGLFWRWVGLKGPKGHLRCDWHRSRVTSEPPTLLRFHC